MRLVGQGWRALALVTLLSACDGGGGTDTPRATTVAANSATTQTALAGTAVGEAPSVRVTDQDGDPMQGVAVTFVAAGGGSVASASATTNASGVASAGTWTLGPTPGTQTVTATAGSLPAVTFSATAQARAAGSITAISATTQTALAGTAVAESPAVRVNDQAGQPLAGATVTFAVTAGGGTVGSTTVTTGANGTASANGWTLGAAGANTVTATVAGLTPVAFNATAQARTAATVTPVSATTQSAAAGAAVAAPPSVRVNDQTGQPLAGVTVTFAVASGGGTLTGATATTNAAGVATAGSWTLGAAAGTNTVTATVAGLAPVTFTATATTGGAPASIVAVSATTQTGTPGSPVQAPVVRVNNAAGQPVAGVTVTFAVTAGGGTLGQTTATTGANGQASAASWTLGPAAGTNTVTATVAGLPAVTFTATAGDPCSVARVYTLFSTVTGELTTADCELTGGEYLDFYATSLPSAQAVTFTMSSSEVDSWLELYDGSQNFVAYNDDAAQGNPNSQIRVFAPSGNYLLGATSFDVAETGSYELSSIGLGGNVNCLEYWVVPGVVINGQVQASDCDFDGFLADEYLLVLYPGQTLTVRMESTALDAYLELYNSEFTLVASDDDSAGGNNATLTYTATEADIFFLDATGALQGQTGAYSLTVTRN